MATYKTYKLIPSSLTAEGSGVTITNETNAYTDTSSTTFASVNAGSMPDTSFPSIYLGGFDFSVIPSNESILSMVVKVKCRASLRDGSATLMSAPDGVALSETSVLTADSLEVYTLSITAQPETIRQYADRLCIKLTQYTNYTIRIYGAELGIAAVRMDKSKVIYGNKTLIDLTSDTATEADVASGKTFHLANGIQAIGELSPSVATATTSGASKRIVSFTVDKEPSWFMLICALATTTSPYRVQHILYDGTTTTTYYGDGSTTGTIARSTSYGTFSYSSGTLTIILTAAYFAAADWSLYYL